MKIIKMIVSGNKRKLFLFSIIAVLIAALSNLIPILSQKVFDNGILKSDISSIVIFTSIIILIQLTKGILTYYNDFYISALGTNVVSNTKNRLMKEIIQKPLAFFDNKSSSYISSRVNEVNSFSLFFTPTFFDFIACTLSIMVS